MIPYYNKPKNVCYLDQPYNEFWKFIYGNIIYLKMS